MLFQIMAGTYCMTTYDDTGYGSVWRSVSSSANELLCEIHTDTDISEYVGIKCVIFGKPLSKCEDVPLIWPEGFYIAHDEMEKVENPATDIEYIYSVDQQ